MAKKLFIKTYGCQMNVYDSARMADVLAPIGYAPTATASDADMVILNTCHIREKAAEKVYSELGRLRSLKAKRQARGDGMIIAVAGCVAQAEGAEIRRRAPCVDMVFGPQAYHRLPEMVAKAVRRTMGREGILETDFSVEDKFDRLPEDSAPQGPAAFLTVQEGCDKFCTFCVVPYTRGPEFSRPVTALAAEARRLMAQGAREITLLGQNVNAYLGEGLDGRPWRLGRLIRTLADIDGLERIRYTTSHPRDMDDDLIAAHAEVPQLMPYLHLPVQSGSDRILAAMNRRHSAADYVRLIERLRAARPDLAVSSDFIVGFPGETEADFEDTMNLIHTVRYAQAYSFKYSPRPGTPASELTPQVPEDVKAARLDALQARLRHQQAAFNRAAVGQIMPLLLDRAGRRPDQLVGRSPWLQAVHVDAPPHLWGAMVEAQITSATSNSLAGRLVAMADAVSPSAPARSTEGAAA